MWILNALFGNKEISEAFVDGQTTFTLNSDTDEGGGIFQNIACRLIKTVRHTRRQNLYFVKTEQVFSGIDFGIGGVQVSNFVVVIRNLNIFEMNKENDVIVYLQTDVKHPLDFFDDSIKGLKVVDWASISNIRKE